jgi:hypothetical protein
MSILGDLGTKTGAEFKKHRLRIESLEANDLSDGGNVTGDIILDNNENLIAKRDTSINGATTNTTRVQGRAIDIYAYNDVNLRAGSADNINLTAGGTAFLNGSEIATMDSLPTASSIEYLTINKVDAFNDGSGLALYKLNGNGLDYGNRYNLTGAVTYTNAGRYGLARHDIKVQNNETLGTQLNNSNAAISYWIKVSSEANNSWNNIFTFTDSSINGHWRWGNWYHGNQNGSLHPHYNGAGISITTGKVKINDWSHVVETFKNDTHNTYIDKVLTDSFDRPVVTDMVNFQLGNSSWQGGSNIELDHVRIFNRALEQSDVDFLYNEEKVEISKTSGKINNVYYAKTSIEVSTTSTTYQTVLTKTIYMNTDDYNYLIEWHTPVKKMGVSDGVDLGILIDDNIISEAGHRLYDSNANTHANQSIKGMVTSDYKGYFSIKGAIASYSTNTVSTHDNHSNSGSSLTIWEIEK